jgi:serine/threonine protein kinase
LRAGDILAGKYRVERVLGIGGMGVVVAAQHILLEDRVAIKLLRPEMLADVAAVERFAREARAVVKIKSEHVARVFDVGTLEDGTPYMVMEFLEGGDLATWLEYRGPLPVEQAVEFVLQTCVAVAEAHALGIVHRDLKPANLFCVQRSDGQLAVKVLDFGISKVAGLATSGTSPREGDRSGTGALGSPFYMSPEQMHGSKDVGPQADIWALGVILYELLTGQVPFPGETVAEVALKVIAHAPVPARHFRPELPEELDALIGRCLERDTRERFADIPALAEALQPFGPAEHMRSAVDRIAGIIESARAPDEVTSPRIPKSAMETTQTASARMVPPADPGAKRRRATVGAVAIGIVMAVVGGSLALRPRGDVQATNPLPLQAREAPAAPAGISVPSPPPAPVATSSPLPTPTDFSLVPVASSTSSRGPKPTPGASPTPRPAAARPRRKDNCRLVSYFDGDGDQHFRQDCGN